MTQEMMGFWGAIAQVTVKITASNIRQQRINELDAMESLTLLVNYC